MNMNKTFKYLFQREFTERERKEREAVRTNPYSLEAIEAFKTIKKWCMAMVDDAKGICTDCNRCPIRYCTDDNMSFAEHADEMIKLLEEKLGGDS